ncbi:DUF6869 domain-containing protein [Saezia sanguinis]|nr:hypothetical protein [Saezia sanguinis]
MMLLISGIDPSNIGPSEISRIAKAWIERYEKINLDDEKPMILPADTNPWGDAAMFDLVNYFPGKAFLVIDEVLLQTDHEAVLCNLAAGPLESLLAKYGEAVMPQIEYRAKNSGKFRGLFSWMYQVTSDELWEQIVALVNIDR